MDQVLTFAHSPFELHAPYAPAGDQGQAIEELTEGVKEGLTAQTLLGVTGSGKCHCPDRRSRTDYGAQ